MGLTYQDVYDIAAEVSQETVKKFLSNLVKLVPDAESVVSDIQEQQFRNRNNRANTPRPQIRKPAYQQSVAEPVEDQDYYIGDETEEDEFANIAHPKVRVQEQVARPVQRDEFAEIAHPNQPTVTGLEDDFLGAIARDMPPLGVDQGDIKPR